MNEKNVRTEVEEGKLNILKDMQSAANHLKKNAEASLLLGEEVARPSWEVEYGEEDDEEDEDEDKEEDEDEDEKREDSNQIDITCLIEGIGED